MQLTKRHNHISSNGNIGEQSDFNIAVNAKMFRVLSDTMYQDKIGSIVREISCNAKDAHTEAGTPKLPFIVHVPNAIEPWFSVKDFGTGMSDGDVRGLYTTYGESTRDQTNEVTGGFGLGSKTPFAYTDQFTIISIFGGMQRTYVAVINDEGLPVLNMQDERKSGEHAGLEINMAVSNEDFDSFRSAITKQLRFFKVKPTLENNMSEIAFPDMDESVSFENEDVTIYKGGYNSERPLRDLYVVQGEVGYPVDINLLDGIPSEVAEFANAIDSSGAYFEAAIGTISVTANREGISYEPDTIAAIIGELKRISSSICVNAIADIKAQKLVWNKCAIFNNQISVMKNAIASSMDLSKVILGATKSNNTKKMALKLDSLTNAGLKVVQFSKHEYRKRGSSYSADKGWRLSRVEFNSPDADNNSQYGHGTFLYPTDEYDVILRDTSSKPVARLKQYASENDFPQILVVESGLGGKTDVTIKQAALALKISESRITLLSTLEAPAVNSNGTPAGKRARGYMLSSNSDSYSSKDWTPVMDLDDVGEAVVIGMERHSLNLNDDARQAITLAKADHLGMPVVAVNQQTFARIQKGKVGEELVTPTEALAPIKELVEMLTPEYKRFIRLESFIDGVKSSTALQWMNKTGIAGVVSSEIVAKLAKLEAHAAKVKAGFEGYEYHLRAVANVRDAAREADKAADKLTDKLDAKYPMLRHLSTWNDSENEDAINYINLVDSTC